MNDMIPLDRLVEGQKDVVGVRVDLPGRLSIYTDGVQFPLAIDNRQAQQQHDAQNLNRVHTMTDRLMRRVREQLENDGRRVQDWNVTVTVAVHHKGQATEFWIGDAPERKPTDKNLPEHLCRPHNETRIDVR